MLNEIGEQILIAGVTGVIGGVAAFCYEVDTKGRECTVRGFVLMSVVSFVVAAIAGQLLPKNKEFYGLTMLAGMHAYQIYGISSRRIISIMKKFGNK